MTKHAFISALILAAPFTILAQDSQTSLERALQSARSTRPAVTAAEQRLASARLNRRALGAWPTTRLSVGFTTDPETGGSDDDLVLSQPFDFFGRVGASAAVGDALIAQAQADYQVTLATLQSEVVEAYAELAAAEQLTATSRENADIAQRLHDAVKALVEEGRLPGVQLTRVKIELERAKLALAQREAERSAARLRLSALSGLPAADVAVAEFATPNVQMIDPAQLLERRADLQVLDAEARVLDAEAKVASLGNRPEFEIQARRNAWQDEESRFGLRLQLNIPINDFGRTRNETAAARTRAQAARKVLEDSLRVAEGELLATRTELEAATEQVRRFEEIRESAASLVEVSQAGFTDRAVTLIELLEATRALREVEEGLVEARLRLARAQAAYLRASGQLLEVAP